MKGNTRYITDRYSYLKIRNHYRKHLNFVGQKPTKISVNRRKYTIFVGAAENKFDENNLFSSASPRPTKIVGQLTIYVGLGGRRK
jgi:hypothetical protein